MTTPTDTPTPARRMALAALAAGLMPVVPSCGWLTDRPVAVAAHVWVGYEPMFMASDRHWSDPGLVQLLPTRSAAESVAALRSGRVQAAGLTLDEVLAARASGLALSVVLVFNISTGADLLVARPKFRQLADLKGGRIGYEASSVGELMLFEVLQVAGWSRQDVSLVNVAVDQQAYAWRHQYLDAVISYEPVATQLLALGGVRLFDSRQIPGTIVDVLAVRKDALERAYSTALRNLIKGHFRALEHLQRDPQDAARRMAPRLNLPPSGVLSAYKGLVLPGAEENYRLLAGTQPTLLATAQRVNQVLLGIGSVHQPDQLAGLVRADFLPTEALSG